MFVEDDMIDFETELLDSLIRKNLMKPPSVQMIEFIEGDVFEHCLAKAA